jgi:hypothetical protein
MEEAPPLVDVSVLELLFLVLLVPPLLLQLAFQHPTEKPLTDEGAVSNRRSAAIKTNRSRLDDSDLLLCRFAPTVAVNG